MTLTEAEYLVEAAHQHQIALRVVDRTRDNLVATMRRNYANGMSIVELARISGFSRPTVMKYVQNVTTATVEP
jgi:predicted transcriptional regulator